MEDLELILKHQVCIEVPETECEVVGYTECSTDTYKEPSREDKVAASSSTSWNWLDALQVVGEYFYEQECTRREIEITEVKKHPHCVNMTKVNFPVEQVHKSYTEFDITRTSISLISWKFLVFASRIYVRSNGFLTPPTGKMSIASKFSKVLPWIYKAKYATFLQSLNLKEKHLQGENLAKLHSCSSSCAYHYRTLCLQTHRNLVWQLSFNQCFVLTSSTRRCTGTISSRGWTASAKRQEHRVRRELEFMIGNISEDIIVCAEGCASLQDKAC